MITFATWVNNHDLYKDFYTSVPFSAEFLPLGQSFTSLSDAYAHAQEMAKGDIIVYCHQDIIIHDKDFEKKVTDFFSKQTNTGFCGVIGNTKPNTGSWWTVPDRKGWVRQTDLTGQHKPTVHDFGRGVFSAAQLDGLMLITNRKDWDWPELPGIHFLDLWMCNLACERGMNNYILDLDIEHRSWGETDSQHYKDNHKIYLERWNEFLTKNQ